MLRHGGTAVRLGTAPDLHDCLQEGRITSNALDYVATSFASFRKAMPTRPRQDARIQGAHPTRAAQPKERNIVEMASGTGPASTDHSAPQPRFGRTWYLGIVVLALLTRLCVFAINSSHPVPFMLAPDSHGYISAGESLRSHFAILDGAGAPTWSRVPGFPLLLALCFKTGIASPDHIRGAILVQILLGSFGVAMAARTTHLLAGSTPAAWVGVLLAVEPSSIAYSNMLLSETLYTFMLLAALMACWRWLRSSSLASLALFAALVGTLPLIRPIALYLPPLLSLIIGLDRRSARRWTPALLFVVISSLPAAAWCGRNYYYLGSAELDRIGPLAQAIYARNIELEAGAPATPGPEAQPWEPEFAKQRGLTVPEAIRVQKQYFWRTVAAHPAGAVAHLLVTAVLTLGVPSGLLPLQLLDNPPGYEEGSFLGRLAWLTQLGPLSGIIILGMVISVGGFGLIPIVVLRARRWDPVKKRLVILIVLLVIYHLSFASFLRQQGDRYRAPIVPLLAMTLVLGLTRKPGGTARSQADMKFPIEHRVPRRDLA